METKVNSYMKSAQAEASERPAKQLIQKPDFGDIALSEDQRKDLKRKYDLIYMTREEEAMLLQDLQKMGALTNEDCSAYTAVSGNIFEALTRQISSDIYLLYQMSLSGSCGDAHIEHIRSRQKILEVLGQLATEEEPPQLP